MAFPAAVVVTGVGLVTSAGGSLDEVWERALSGRSGIGPLRAFDPGPYASAAAEVAPFDVAEDLHVPKNAKFMARPVACAARAAHRAVRASGVDLDALDPYRIALYTGSGQTGLEADEFFDALETAGGTTAESDYRLMGGRASRRIDRYWSLRTLANAGTGLLAVEFSARGGSNNFIQGDTASALALSAGAWDLLEGRADVAIVGGYDSLLTPSTLVAYQHAGLLSTLPPDRAQRPFDRARDGLVLGEAAAFLVLERAEDARRRGAPLVGELVGIGVAQEPIDRARPKACGASLQTAWREAVGASRVDLVVAHGLGTRDDDRDEAVVLRRVVRDAPITALKGLTGYVGAATAALEAAVALAVVQHRVAPPVCRLDAAADDCALPLVVGAPRSLDAEEPTAVALSWSWAGQCAAVAVRSCC